MLAVVHVSELYRPDLGHEVKRVFGTTDKAHPGVSYLLNKVNPVYVAGELEVVSPPVPLRLQVAPPGPGPVPGAFLRAGLGENRRVPDPQPDAPRPRRAHAAGGPPDRGQPAYPSLRSGMTKPGDVDHHTRVRCYQAVLKGYPHSTATLSLYCPWPCAWAAPGRPFGTPLSARTTGPVTSSWAVTTPARATTRPANPSMAPTTPRPCSASTPAEIEHRHGALPADGLCGGPGRVHARRRGPGGHQGARHFRHRTTQASGGRT